MSSVATDIDFAASAPPRRQVGLDIEILECPQGSPEWHAGRAGVITASMYAEIRRIIGGLTAQQQTYVDAIRAGEGEKDARDRAGYKAAPKSDSIRRAIEGERIGDYSNAAKDYAFRLAIERICGEPLQDERYETYAMRRGHDQEPDARSLHAINTGYRIKQTGLVRTTDGRFGASADGLILAADNAGKITTDGGAEYKCFTSPEKLRRILIDGDIEPELDQIYGCMWLTGYRWWQFCLYSENLVPAERELTIITVERDDAYVERLEADLVVFDRYVEATKALILERRGQIYIPSPASKT
jgi:hypothetical protein